QSPRRCDRERESDGETCDMRGSFRGIHSRSQALLLCLGTHWLRSSAARPLQILHVSSTSAKRSFAAARSQAGLGNETNSSLHAASFERAVFPERIQGLLEIRG